MKSIIALLFVLISLNSFSCGNEYGYSLNGDRIFTRFFYMSSAHRNFDKAEIKKQLKKAQAKPNATSDFKIQSNIALYHMKLGDVKKALAILEPLMEKHPDEYTIAANLGTAYELNGQLDEALEYITKGYKLNPDSHLGSEWIHMLILEGKIKEKNNPGWLAKNSIVSIDLLHKSIGKHRHRFRDNHLEFQIRTRVPFTPGPNKVMANLLESLAEYNVLHGSYENAVVAYTYIFEFTDSQMKKREISRKIIELNEKRKASGIKELNFSFKRLIESGEIDPQLMLYGIDELADQLQQEDEATFATKDSLRMMSAKVDSLSNIKPETKSKKKKESSNNGTLFGFVFGVIGLVLGIVIATVAMRKRK